MFQFRDDWSYRMPVQFCGNEGTGVASQRYDDITELTMRYLTDREQLAQYVPDAFELLDPVVTVAHQTCRGVRWMGGGYYNLVNVSVPARHIASGTEGVYVLVIWENKTAPILGGREETGMPKIFADISAHQVYEQHVLAHASHEGRVFVELHAELSRDLDEHEVKALDCHIGQLGWRYIPNVGRPGAALSHATVYPVDVSYRSASEGTGTITWTKANPWFNPLQSQIVNALADLPIMEYQSCLFARSVADLRGDLARELAETGGNV